MNKRVVERALLNSYKFSPIHSVILTGKIHWYLEAVAYNNRLKYEREPVPRPQWVYGSYAFAVRYYTQGKVVCLWYFPCSSQQAGWPQGSDVEYLLQCASGRRPEIPCARLRTPRESHNLWSEQTRRSWMWHIYIYIYLMENLGTVAWEANVIVTPFRGT